MRQSITLNKRAFELILTQCGMTKSLSDAGERIRQFGAEEYTAVRDGMLLDGELFELDFDGKVHIKSPLLSRYVYCIMKSSSAMFSRRADQLTVYLKSPVDVTVLSYDGDNVTISSETYVSVYDTVNEYTKNGLGLISVISLSDDDDEVLTSDLSADEKRVADNVIGRFMISGVKLFLGETEDK